MNESEFHSNDENLTVENLQDLLIYDDTFLDYFNVFLKLPVFPQQLEYKRLTDSFRIIDEGSDAVVSCDTQPFMASKEEHTRLLEWAQKYRLPLFLKTDLFRELKLSKLLIRPLEFVPSSSRETFLHGYSKQTNCSSFTTPTPSKYSELSTKSNSMGKSLGSNNSSAYKKGKSYPLADDDFIEIDEEDIEYEIYLRPGSRAISLPIQIKLETWPNYENFHSSAKRIQSAPLNFDAINFDSINEEMEESLIDELEALEGRQKISFQRLKEIIIGSHDGIHELMNFLLKTAGKYLCEFWLDCEQVKDFSAFRTPEENTDLIYSLLRNLKDKYKLSLTKAAKDQLNEAMKNPDKLHSIFSQAQYDSLRRLRSYWLPRYLIHQESMMRQFTFSDLLYLRLPTFQSDKFSIQSMNFPKLILQNGLPYLINETEILSKSWNQLICCTNNSFSESSRLDPVNREKSTFTDGIFKRTAFQKRLRFALGCDTAAGCPFKNYLQSHSLILQKKHLEFFQEVFLFKSKFSQNSDRLLRLSEAWSIVNRFISKSGSQFLEISEEQSQSIIKNMKKYKTSMNKEIFDGLIEVSVKVLQNEWLIYLKDDVKLFMESSLTHFDDDIPPNTIDEIDVKIVGEVIVVRRKSIIKEVDPKSRTWDQLSNEERQRRRKEALELKRITEIERKRVLRAVEKRIRMQNEERKLKVTPLMKFQQKPKTDTVENDSDGIIEDSALAGTETEIKVEEKIPEIKRAMTNKVLLNLFKKFVTDRTDVVGKEVMHSVMLLQDVSTYMSVEGTDKSAVAKKDAKATAIYKLYIDKGAKRPVPLSEKIRSKLPNAQERPKTPVLKEIQNHVYNSLNEVYNEFWKYETLELGVKSDILAKMTEKELLLLAENQLTESSLSGGKVTSTAAYTKEDKRNFISALDDTSYQPLTLQLLYFFSYLLEKGPEDKMNNLEKDLFFYVEVLKLKEICRTSIDEDIAKKKIQCISNTFLESVYPPTVQINISNDISQRIVKVVQKQLNNKEINISLFDDAQNQCLKNLLPYWAGFQRQWREPVDMKYSLISKYHKLLERRLKMYNDIPIPNVDMVSLPVVSKNNNLTTLTYTMNEGVKWKQSQEATMDLATRRDSVWSEAGRSTNPLGKRFSKNISVT